MFDVASYHTFDIMIILVDLGWSYSGCQDLSCISTNNQIVYSALPHLYFSKFCGKPKRVTQCKPDWIIQLYMKKSKTNRDLFDMKRQRTYAKP